MRRRHGWWAVVGAALMACAANGQGGGDPAHPAASGTLRVTGVVRKAVVGVNCWRFEGSDGTAYELMPSLAPEEVLRDGQRFTLILSPRADLMSTCMVGKIVEVVRVVSR